MQDEDLIAEVDYGADITGKIRQEFCKIKYSFRPSDLW